MIACLARLGRVLIVVMLAVSTSCSDRDSAPGATSQPSAHNRPAREFTPDEARVAREALQRLHNACDEWAKARADGVSTASARKNFNRASWDFERSLKDTIYNEGRASMWVHDVAAAGSYKDDEGQEWSYLFGTGQTGLIVAAWSRAPWSGDSPRGFGIAFVVGINPEDLQPDFHVGAGRWNTSGDVLRVPYVLVDQFGTFEMRLTEGKWSFHPDRGTVDGHWWKPDAGVASTGPVGVVKD